jgi:hypothetical protein
MLPALGCRKPANRGGSEHPDSDASNKPCHVHPPRMRKNAKTDLV